MATGVTKDGQRTKPKTTSTFSWVSDKFAAGAARVNGGEFQDVEIAVVKATNHDVTPPKEKHVRTLREIISSSTNRKKVIYIVHALYERLIAPNEMWLVVLKALMVFHKLLKADGEASFKQEIARYKEKRKVTELLRLNNFSDKSQKESWDYSAFVRVYSNYLEERIHVFETIKFDVDRDGGGTNVRFKTASGQELLEELPKVQKLLQRILACLPEGAAAESEVVMEAMRWILTECFRVYRVISEGIINLAEQFFEMDRIDATKALEMYRESINSTTQMQTFFNAIQSLSIGRQIQFPQLTSPPDDFVLQMEEYVKGATGRTTLRKFPSTVGRNVHGSPSPALASNSTGGSAAPKIVVSLETTPEQPAQPQATAPADDLLGLDALDFNPTPAPAPAPQAAAPAADPFGDTIFQNSNELPKEPAHFIDDWGQSTSIPSPAALSSVAAEQNTSPFDDFFGGGPMVQPPAPESSSPGSHVQQVPPYNPVQGFGTVPAFQQPAPVAPMASFHQPQHPPMGGFQQLAPVPPFGGFHQTVPVAPMGGFQQQAPPTNNPFGGFAAFDTTPQPFQQFQPVTPQMPVRPSVPQASPHSGPGAFADPFEGLTTDIQKKPSYAPPGAPMRQDAAAGNPFGSTPPVQGTTQQSSATGQQDFASFF